jgi:hypothetical protein
MNCSFCGRKPAVGFSKTRKVGVCSECIDDAAGMTSEARAAGEAAKPMVAPGEDKLSRLMRDAKGPAALGRASDIPAARPPLVRAPQTALQRAAQRARGRARGELAPEALSLSLLATAEAQRVRSQQMLRQRKPASPQERIRASVRKAGLKTG